MITRSLAKSLERLEAHRAPPSDEPALVIRMTCVGQEDRIIEVRGDNTADRRRRSWPPASVRGLELRVINTRLRRLPNLPAPLDHPARFLD